MKKSIRSIILLLLVLIGVGFWLLRATDAEHLTRQDVVIDVQDTFEK